MTERESERVKERERESEREREWKVKLRGEVGGREIKSEEEEDAK